jgi:uncharacterized membrane protein
MESKIKILGHPVHPMLVMFPLGLFVTAVIFDILYLMGGNPVLPSISYYLIAAGLITGAIAAVFGFIDWLGLPYNSRAWNLGLIHGIGNIFILGLFLLSWLWRGRDLLPNAAIITISLVAFALALVTAWLGGELVYRLGVGVDRGAHLNAPSSLTNRSSSREEKSGQTEPTAHP